MYHIYLQRHGESLSNIKDLFTCRKLDPGLSEYGKSQINNKILYFSDKRISRIYSSPSLRTIETSQILSKALGVEYLVDPNLLEVNVGYLEGLNDKEPENSKIFFDALNDWAVRKENLSFIDGESLKDIELRIRNIINKFFNHVSENIILVGHAAFFSLVLNEFVNRKNIKDLFLRRGGTARYDSKEKNWLINI
jgi:probable phosphoglycerate mutase